MKYAPIGIGAAIAVTVGHSGIGVLINLGKLVLTLYGALIEFAGFICPLTPLENELRARAGLGRLGLAFGVDTVAAGALAPPPPRFPIPGR